MCGIIGIITSRPGDEARAALARGTRAMGHRGPDDEGLEVVAAAEVTGGLTAAFGHRRLSILDLSSAGHQPMRDAASGNWIAYNGEVFNFHEVRSALERRGVAFHSGTDTEVLLKGLGLRGLGAVADWRGMFALGFWEARQRRLTLIRDRLGIKPLYYYHDGETLLFASEVRALLATGLVPRRLSRAAVESYLAYGSVQQPLTMIENVYAVLPGHALTWEGGGLRAERYWELRAEAQPARAGRGLYAGRELVEEVGALLAEAVRLRLVADVPVAAFLSGGIDSSAVVALMRRATNGAIKTFSVCFNEQEFSEHVYAERVAREFGAEHHPVLLTEQGVLAKVPAALAAMDQPSVDGVNTYVVSEAVARSGIKVALSGLGGDEVFAGYGFFRTVERDERRRALMENLPPVARRAMAAAVETFGHGHRAVKLSELLRSRLDEHSVLLHRQLFTESQRHTLLAANGYRRGQVECDRSLLGAWEGDQRRRYLDADLVNQASLYDLGGYLSNTLLRDTDAMSMAHGLEVRVPLIDHHLVERLLSVPGAVKLSRATPKWLLVEAVGDLPREVVERPKQGFELPFRNWLAGALRDEVESTLLDSPLTALLREGAAEGVWRGFLAGRTTWSRVWALYVLGRWADLNLGR
jgi:asparagine synthase (glutamine-hydrolysing)